MILGLLIWSLFGVLVGLVVGWVVGVRVTDRAWSNHLTEEAEGRRSILTRVR